jgi:hypothetical protein
MKIDQHPAASSFTTNLVIEVNQQLIVALHEINLQKNFLPCDNKRCNRLQN